MMTGLNFSVIIARFGNLFVAMFNYSIKKSCIDSHRKISDKPKFICLQKIKQVNKNMCQPC